MKSILFALLLSSVLFAGCLDSLEGWRGALSFRPAREGAFGSRPISEGAIVGGDPKLIFNKTGPSATYLTPDECIEGAGRAGVGLLREDLRGLWLSSCFANAARASQNENYCLKIGEVAGVQAQAHDQIISCVTTVARDSRRRAACDVLAQADRAPCTNAALPEEVYAIPELSGD